MAAIPVRELVTIWGFDIKDKPLKQMEVGVNNIKSSLAVVGAIAVGAAASLFGLAKSTANAGETVSKLSQETGVGVEALQELTFAAEQSGIAQNDLVSVLKDLSNRSFDVIEGNQKQALAFRRLGVQVANSAGDLRDADDVLLDLADSFQKLPDGAEKTVLATQALGGAGAKLIPFLNKGSAGIKEMREEAKRLGIVLGRDTVDASVKFNESLRKALGALKGIKNTLGAELLPVIQKVIEEFTAFVVTNRKLIATKVRQFIEVLKFALQNALIILGNFLKVLTAVSGALGGAETAMKLLIGAVSVFLGLKLLSGIGALAIGMGNLVKAWRAGTLAANSFNISALLIPVIVGVIIAAIALLVEDFIAFSDGRDSVIGRTIKVLREDFPNAFKVLKGVFDLISAIIDNQIQAWKNLFEFIKFGFGGIVDFFSNTILPFFKKIFEGSLLGKALNFLTSKNTLDIVSGGLEAATSAVQGNTASISGAGGAPSGGSSGIVNNARSSNVNQTFNINADSLSKDEATKAVETGVAKAMGGVLRETERDVTSAVER